MYIRTQTADCQVEDVTDDENQHEGNHADDVEARHGAQKVKDVCNDAAGKTQRQDMKELARRLEKEIPHFYDHMASALRHSDKEELWPEKLPQKTMLERFRAFWKKS